MTSTAASPAQGEAKLVALAYLTPSPFQRRKDPGDVAGLQASIAAQGLLQPLLVRPVAAKKGASGSWEIVAGHRRAAALRVLGHESATCLVREMTDAEARTAVLVENAQRLDLHPLEEAECYADLLADDGGDLAKLAGRVGRSARHVYDRLALLKLAPAAKKLFREGAFTAAHAAILARLAPTDQARALASHGASWGKVGGLFEPDHGDDGQGDLGFGKRPVKPVSVREFAKWVDDQVRFEREKTDALLFPATAATLAAAAERKETVVPITHDFQVPEPARDKGERTYGPLSWKRADGAKAYDPRTGCSEPSKPCEHAVTGVVVVGPGRGEAFKVCVAKKKCAVHWPPKPKATGKEAAKREGEAEAERKRREAEVRREQAEQAARARWEKATPQLRTAIAAAVKRCSAAADGPLGAVLLGDRQRSKKDLAAVGTTAADLVRYLALQELLADLSRWGAWRSEVAALKSVGVDAAAIVEKVNGPSPAASARTEQKAKRAKGRKGAKA